MTNPPAEHSSVAAPPPTAAQPACHGLPSHPPEPPEVCELIQTLVAEAQHLKVARDTNRRIGLAMGIVMRERQIDDEQAFAVLARVSQDTNRKLRDVAEDVIRNRHS
jgi:hypothetical protein